MRKISNKKFVSGSFFSAAIQKRKRTVSVLAMATALASAAGLQAVAQEASPADVQEDGTARLGTITVVARKRAENLQDVPDALSVLSQDVVEAGNLDQVEDFVELVPNATLSTDSETSSEISIRGSGRNTQDEDPGVGLYKDGIYIGGRLFSTATFYDTERVEALRGPQAGLYGRNAVGGAVNVISSRPEMNDSSGYVDVQVGSTDRQEVRAALNVPLVEDMLALRVSGLLVNQDDGFNYVVNEDNFTDAGEISSARGRLLFTPSQNLEFLTTVEYIETDGFQSLLVPAPNEPTGYLGEDFVFPVPGTREEDTLNQFRDWPTFQEFEQFHIYEEVNWTLDAGTVTGIISFRDTGYSMSRDDDYSNFLVSGREYNADQESTFAELRYASENDGPFNYLVGLNYLDEETDLSYDTFLGGNFAGPVGFSLADAYATGFIPGTSTPISALGLTPGLTGFGGVLGDSGNLRFDNVQKLESLSAFAEVNYELNSQWEVWANGRWTEDEKTIDFGQSFINCDACAEVLIVFTGSDFEIAGVNTSKFDNVSLGGGVNYRPTDDMLAYAKIVQGFKGGGFNPISATPELQAFDSEETISYEIGLKSEFLDNRVILNLAAFIQERSDALVRVDDPNLDVNTIGVNAGEIKNSGFEVELSVAPIEDLRLDFSYGYLDAEFEDFVSGGDDFSGNKLPRSFEQTFTAIMTYTRPITSELELYSFASYNNSWDGYVDNDNIYKLENPEIVDLRLGFETANELRVGVFVDNAFDNRYVSFEDNTGESLARGTFAPGRTYGVQLIKKF